MACFGDVPVFLTNSSFFCKVGYFLQYDELSPGTHFAGAGGPFLACFWLVLACFWPIFAHWGVLGLIWTCAIGLCSPHCLALLDPLLLMNFRARVSHHHSPCRAAVRTCGAAMELAYKAIRQPGIPPTVVISAPGLLVGSGMDTRLRGFLHAEP